MARPCVAGVHVCPWARGAGVLGSSCPLGGGRLLLHSHLLLREDRHFPGSNFLSER